MSERDDWHVDREDAVSASGLETLRDRNIFRAGWQAARRTVSGQEAEPYRIGNTYRTQSGELVKLVEVANEGTSYESMACEKGIHRYTRRDFGRCTGSAHDYSDPRNIPPLYAAPIPATEQKEPK